MNKRLIATVLWFVSMWVVGSAIDFATGEEYLWLAPTLGLLFGGLAAVDPFHVFRAEAASRSG